MNSPLQMIVDCDPGHDDAIALVVAAKYANLVGVTTVAGNAPIAATTRNARIVLDMIGSSAPLHQGAHRPLVAPPRDAAYVHGESGLDGADLPAPSRAADSNDAVSYIIETCRATEGIWLAPTGPLTNIALALRSAPDLRDRIAGISLMGGGTFGNRTTVAEFNIWADPEAAAMVF
jgi:inosine-uridine nucleoside N-ribohydrolase